jgi:nicotinamide mononucleotide transporter
MISLDWLGAALFSGMSLLEWVAALLLLINVTLVARRSVLNYPFAIGAVLIYAIIAFENQLFSNMVLQLIFLALNLYGFWTWRQASGADAVPVGWMTQEARLIWAAAVLVGWGLWSTAMNQWTNAADPYVDGAVVALSVTAQWLQAQRRVECWWLWMAANIVTVPLLASHQLYVSAGVYAVLLALAAAGLMAWDRAARGNGAVSV